MGKHRTQQQAAKQARKRAMMERPGGSSRYAERVRQRGYATMRMSEGGREKKAPVA